MPKNDNPSDAALRKSDNQIAHFKLYQSQKLLENQLSLLADRGKSLTDKYAYLIEKLAEFGIDFILPLGQSD